MRWSMVPCDCDSLIGSPILNNPMNRSKMSSPVDGESSAVCREE